MGRIWKYPELLFIAARSFCSISGRIPLEPQLTELSFKALLRIGGWIRGLAADHRTDRLAAVPQLLSLNRLRHELRSKKSPPFRRASSSKVNFVQKLNFAPS